MARIIPLQPELRPVLPTVRGNVDYLRFEAELQRMDALLQLSGAETLFVELSLDHWLTRLAPRPHGPEQEKFQRSSRQALRCVVLQRILGEGYRG